MIEDAQCKQEIRDLAYDYVYQDMVVVLQGRDFLTVITLGCLNAMHVDNSEQFHQHRTRLKECGNRNRVPGNFRDSRYVLVTFIETPLVGVQIGQEESPPWAEFARQSLQGAWNVFRGQSGYLGEELKSAHVLLCVE
jgi:hypothetical protein